MREIGILTHSFLDAYNGKIDMIYGGGLERYLYDLSETIKELGLIPVIYQLSYCGSFQTEVNGIRVIGYDCTDKNIVDVFNLMSAEAKGLLIYASFIWQPIDYKEGSIGICHGINWDHHAASVDHKSDVASNVQNALKKLKRIVSVDSHFLSFCRSVCSYSNADKVLLLPNSVDTAHFTVSIEEEDKENIHILYPRRISIERGIVPMMLVADRLLETYDQVTIEFAGATIEDSLITKAFDLWMQYHPNQDRITHKAYSFDVMPQAYWKADIAVIPTIFSEGTSYSCLEALSCGVPLVSANVGGLNDLIIDGFNGLLVTPTEERLFQAICSLIENKDMREQLGANARHTAQAFDKQIWKRKWRDILTESFDLNKRVISAGHDFTLPTQEEEAQKQVWDQLWSREISYQWDPLSEVIFNFLIEKIGPLRDQQICEAGSGTGKISLRLAMDGAAVTLVDYSAQALEQSRMAFKQKDQQGEFVLADIRKMPIEANKHDLCWSAGVLEHFSLEEKVNILKEMARVTKPGGKVLVLVPYSRSLPYRIGKAYAEANHTWRYGTEIPVDSLKQEFELSDIEVEEERNIGFIQSMDFLDYIPGAEIIKQSAIEWYSELNDKEREFFPGYLLVTLGSVK
ncbi:glycosyltransferase [Paenibacillus anseongensis]|uniref:glycosyltransferase n=1 Tax=Paenibacillus TaxID=44249 RepID=UPI001FEC2A95|nr:MULTISPECIES: glycosyltransferase [Paenibacillus]